MEFSETSQSPGRVLSVEMKMSSQTLLSADYMDHEEHMLKVPIPGQSVTCYLSLLGG